MRDSDPENGAERMLLKIRAHATGVRQLAAICRLGDTYLSRYQAFVRPAIPFVQQFLNDNLDDGRGWHREDRAENSQ